MRSVSNRCNLHSLQAAIAKEEKKEEESIKEANEIRIQVGSQFLLYNKLLFKCTCYHRSRISPIIFQMGKYEQLTLDFQAKKADEEAQLEAIMEGLQEATAELRASLEVAQVRLARCVVVFFRSVRLLACFLSLIIARVPH